MEKINVDIVKLNSTYGRIFSDNYCVIESLYKKFTMRPENYKFSPKYKSGIWDGKIHFVEKNGRFPIGILTKILKYISDNDEYQINIDEEFGEKENKEMLKNDFLEVICEYLDSEFAPYFYQLRGALKAIYHKRSIIEHCTGSGKSFTMALIIIYLIHKHPNFKFLIVVPKIDLVEQLNEEFSRFGIPEDVIGKYFGFEKNEECPITISTWQSIYKNKNFLKQIDVIIVDEAHSLKATVVKSVAEKATKAEYRIALTGTLPDFNTDRLFVESVTGPLVDRVTTSELIKLKKISDIKINSLLLKFNDDILTKLDGVDYQSEKMFIEGNDSRNKIIVNLLEKLCKMKKNSLVLVQKIEHGETLLNLLTKCGINTKMVCGETKLDERNEIRKEMEKIEGQVIVATVGVFSTGISIKKLHNIVFASPGKSKIQTLQSIGRGLRLHNTKKKVMIFDISENTKYSSKHYSKRKSYYKKNDFQFFEKEIDIDAQI